MPTLGRNVLYQRPATAHRAAKLVAAIVTQINDDDTVHLVVFAPNTPVEEVERVDPKLVSDA
jgi:hypothetical protein